MLAGRALSLFELQAWLGHSSPHSTQHYARITAVTLTKAYTDAGYFARNVRDRGSPRPRRDPHGVVGAGGLFEF